MAEPIWFLGPAGFLRPLVCPEINIDVTTERYGGVFQALSGARSMDVTGHRRKYSMEFKWMDQEEYAWLNALHLRQLPGPFRLLDPLQKNRLSVESSLAKWGGGMSQGATLTAGVMTQVWDWPSAVSPGFGLSSKWTNRSGTATLRFDTKHKTTVIAGESITASIYLKTNVGFTPNFVVDWWDRTVQIGSTSVLGAVTTTSWQRFTITATVPANATRAVVALYTTNTTAELYVAAPQFEASASATDWEIGGAAPVVFVDQMPAVSPRFPLRNATVTLLEA